MKVRYDGGHKYNAFLAKTLGPHVRYLPVCPEVECGLPVPREAMRLVGESKAPRLLGIESEADYTAQMESWATTRLEELAHEELCGFIFKSKSPSSGMARVKVYSSAARGTGSPARDGIGIFARMFMERFPLIPVEEDGRLEDPALRENFIERIFVLKRFRESVARGRTARELVAFHTGHKMLIMSHSVERYRELGRLVANAASRPIGDVYREYERTLLASLRLLATPKKHANVLNHLAGFLKDRLIPRERQALAGLIDEYRRGIYPLIVPITLINHFVRMHGQPYLAEQVYLNPHPVELKLRNHL